MKLVPVWYPQRPPLFYSEHKKGPVSGAFSYSGGGIRTRDLRVMSPNQGIRWTMWDTVSSGFREIEIGWDPCGFLPQADPACFDI